jgi:hypothetical protein
MLSSAFTWLSPSTSGDSARHCLQCSPSTSIVGCPVHIGVHSHLWAFSTTAMRVVVSVLVLSEGTWFALGLLTMARIAQSFWGR